MAETKQKAVYELGKMHSKYLIMIIMGYAMPTCLSKVLIYNSSTSMMILLIKNYKELDYWMQEIEVYVIQTRS